MDNFSLYKVALIMFGLITVSTEPIEFKSCPSDEGVTGSATAVQLSPCASQPCNFKHRETVNVKISFTAAEDSPTLQSTVYGIVLGLPVNFPLPNSDGCSNSGIACPIHKGQSYTYNSSFSVIDTYPEITLVVMWKLDGATANDVCFTFPMSIDDKVDIVG